MRKINVIQIVRAPVELATRGVHFLIPKTEGQKKLTHACVGFSFMVTGASISYCAAHVLHLEGTASVMIDTVAWYIHGIGCPPVIEGVRTLYIRIITFIK